MIEGDINDRWARLKARIARGDFLEGRVTSHHPFGVLLDIGEPGVSAVIQITEFETKGVMTPEEFPALGTTVRARVIGFRDSHRQVSLTLKPARADDSGKPM
jgi:ribosomal protein S1